MAIAYSNDPYGNIIKRERPNTPGVNYDYDNELAKTNLRKRTNADIDKMRQLARYDLDEEKNLTKAGLRIAELRDLKNSNSAMSADQLNELYNLEQNIGPLEVITSKLKDIQAQKALKSKMALANVEAQNKAALMPYGDTEAGFKYGKEADIRKAAAKGGKVNTAERRYNNELNVKNLMGKYGISEDPYLPGEYSFQQPLTKEQLAGLAAEAQAMGLNVYMSPDGKISGIVPINQVETSSMTGLGKVEMPENRRLSNGRINIENRTVPTGQKDIRARNSGLGRVKDTVRQKLQPYLDAGLTGAQAAAAITKGQTVIEALDMWGVNKNSNAKSEPELVGPRKSPYEDPSKKDRDEKIEISDDEIRKYRKYHPYETKEKAKKIIMSEKLKAKKRNSDKRSGYKFLMDSLKDLAYPEEANLRNFDRYANIVGPK